METELFVKCSDIKGTPKIFFHELKLLPTGKYQFFIVMEKAICSLKDIHGDRVAREKKWEENELIYMMFHIVSFFCQVEDTKIYHKNLKETNILFMDDGNRILVSDYVSSKKTLHENKIISCTVKQMPDEVLSSILNFKVSFDPHKVEVYSLAMIFLKMGLMKNYLTFEGKNTINSYLEDVKDKLPRLHDIWKSMLQIESKRINLKDLKKALEFYACKFEKSPLMIDFPGYTNSKKLTEWMDRVKELCNITKIYQTHHKLNLVIQKYTEAYNLIMKQDQVTIELIDKLTFCTREIGWFYIYSKDYPNALIYFTYKAEWLQKVDVKEILGELHVYHLYANRDLAIVHLKMCHYKQSLEYNAKFLQEAKSIMGENHFEYIDALEDVAKTYQFQGHLNLAVEHYSKVFERIKHIHGENHPEYIRLLVEIIDAYEEIGDLISSVRFKLELSMKIKSQYGEISLEYTKSLAGIAETYLKLKHYPSAIEFYNLVYLIQKSTSPELHEDVIMTMENLAKLERKRGDFGKAFQLEQQVLDKKNILYVDEQDTNEKFAKSWNNISVTHQLLGNYSKGFEFIKMAFTLYEKLKGIDNPKTQACLRNMYKIAEKINDRYVLEMYASHFPKKENKK